MFFSLPPSPSLSLSRSLSHTLPFSTSVAKFHAFSRFPFLPVSLSFFVSFSLLSVLVAFPVSISSPSSPSLFSLLQAHTPLSLRSLYSSSSLTCYFLFSPPKADISDYLLSFLFPSVYFWPFSLTCNPAHSTLIWIRMKHGFESEIVSTEF